MNENHPRKQSVSSQGKWKFIILSLLGVFLFLIPIPNGETFSIPVGIIIDWVKSIIHSYLLWPMVILVVVNAALTLWTTLSKPDFIMNNEWLKTNFNTTPLYLVSRIIGAIIILLYALNLGPEMVTSAATGGTMIDLAMQLVSVLLVISFAMPLLTSFGIMEFIGILISDYVRPLFRLPGRSAVNVITAWLGASNAAVLLTKQQYDDGYYTGREAAIIMTNFSLVSVPFVYIVAEILGITEYFTPFYLIITLVGVIMGIIMARIPPISTLPETYSKAGRKSDETVPEGYGKLEYAYHQAAKTAENVTFKDALAQGLDMFLSVIFGLSPIIIAWGTIALILVEYTPIFDIISYPMGWYMNLFGIEHAFQAAPATLTGFADMFIPPLMLAPLESAATRFIIGGATLLQLIYMTETGAIMVQSDVPIGFKEILIVFIQRTLIAIPLMWLFTTLFGIF